MANTLLTATAVTREALRILHQKLRFVGTINKEYDDQFAQKGAKIGNNLTIRLPNQYTVRTGPNLSAQDTTENSVILPVTTQKGVDVTFSSQELTMSIDDFGSRILNPMMAVLAAAIESDVLSTVYKDVYQQVNGMGAAATFKNFLNGRKLMVDALTPPDENWSCQLATQDNVDMVDALKGLFQDSEEISSQYKDGLLGRTAGFKFFENTLLPSHPRSGANGAYLTNGATQTGASLIVDTGATAPVAGDIFTIAGVFKVHPETKVSLGILQQFVVGTGATTTLWPISPAIVATGPTQNVSNSAADNSAITIAGTASTTHGLSLEYHKDAFTFATADLIMPQGLHFGARKMQDGISMRCVQQYAIGTDTFPCRFDVLYGFKTIRPQLAARIASN